MSRASLRTLAVLGALLILGLPGVALAQPAPAITAFAAFDPPSASIGDRVTLSIAVTHPEDVVVKAETPNVAEVEVITVIPPATLTGNGTGTGERTVTPPPGMHVTTFAYTLQPFLLGTVDTGPVRLSWLRADGSTGTLEVPGAQLVIAPVRAADDEALRPLKPQLSVDGAPATWFRPTASAAAVALTALLLGALAVIWWRRRAARSEVPVPVDTSPEIAARAELDALPPLLAARLDYEAYYGGLALAVRTYLAARFGFNAHALTTRELERRMVSHGVDRWQARLVAGLLERCDDAVYARRYPDPASADHDLTVAYEIVELSRPVARDDEGQAVPA